MLLFQASCNLATSPALALLRLVCIFTISSASYWGVPVTMIRLLAITIKVGRPRKTILHPEIGCFAATGTRWAIEECNSLQQYIVSRREGEGNIQNLTLVLWLRTILANRPVTISAPLENISGIHLSFTWGVKVVLIDWNASESTKTAVALIGRSRVAPTFLPGSVFNLIKAPHQGIGTTEFLHHLVDLVKHGWFHANTAFVFLPICFLACYPSHNVRFLRICNAKLDIYVRTVTVQKNNEIFARQEPGTTHIVPWQFEHRMGFSHAISQTEQ